MGNECVLFKSFFCVLGRREKEVRTGEERRRLEGLGGERYFSEGIENKPGTWVQELVRIGNVDNMSRRGKTLLRRYAERQRSRRCVRWRFPVIGPVGRRLSVLSCNGCRQESGRVPRQSVAAATMGLIFSGKSSGSAGSYSGSA